MNLGIALVRITESHKRESYCKEILQKFLQGSSRCIDLSKPWDYKQAKVYTKKKEAIIANILCELFPHWLHWLHETGSPGAESLLTWENHHLIIMA